MHKNKISGGNVGFFIMEAKLNVKPDKMWNGVFHFIIVCKTPRMLAKREE